MLNSKQDALGQSLLTQSAMDHHQGLSLRLEAHVQDSIGAWLGH
jgi:hypothetical protein